MRLSQIYMATNQGIRQTVADLVKTVYLTQSQVNNFHRCLVVAVHCDSEKVWKKAVWR